MLFSEIKTRISQNLGDTSTTFYNSDDLIYSTQDGYDDIACLSQCIIRKTTLNFLDGQVYYDFKALGVDDFMAVVAIYNNVSKRWLLDDTSIRQFDIIDEKWEQWEGNSEYWAPLAFNKTAIIPHKAVASGTFELIYWASAPNVVDGESPLFISSFHKLMEFYCTGDLLEQAEEYTKAGVWMKQYFEGVVELKLKTKNIARSDFLRLR